MIEKKEVTEEVLDKIKNWSHKDKYESLMSFVKEHWVYNFWHEYKGNDTLTEYRISTGGWSTNEQIIKALEENEIFWAFCWMQSKRGGHYIFEIKKDF